MRQKVLFVTLLVGLLVSGHAMAGREWFFQPVVDQNGTPLAGGSSAIGMRSGFSWPVVVSERGSAAMVPGGWVPTGNPLISNGLFHIEGITSYDGQKMAFSTSNGEISTFSSSGWGKHLVPTNGYSIPSTAFTGNNETAVLYQTWDNRLELTVQSGGMWNTSSLGIESYDGFALAYDSLNQANVVFNRGESLYYGTKGVMTNNQWNFTRSPDAMYNNYPPRLDLTLTSNDIPYVVYNDSERLSYTTYDRIRGQWQNGIIDMTGNPSSNYCVANDMQGGIGVAYVTNAYDDTRIGFAYTDGVHGWTTELLPNFLYDEWGNPMQDIPVDMMSGIGLAFDAENNPIISFSTGPEVWIAYDPIPEPATCLLLLAGGLGVLRKRK